MENIRKLVVVGILFVYIEQKKANNSKLFRTNK